MDLEFQTVEGSQPEMPSEIDITSSSTVAYIRRNIKTKEDAEGIWIYEEAQTNKDGVIQYLAGELQKAQNAIDYLIINS